MNDGHTGNDNRLGSQRDADLSKQLHHLEEKLAKTKADQEQARSDDGAASSSTSGSAMAYGLRLSSEFVASVLVGASLGWVMDHFLPTSPWGLIAFFLLGFLAGLLNLVRETQRRSTRP